MKTTNDNVYGRDLREYAALNKVAPAGGVVIFGSSFAKDIPTGELQQTFGFDRKIYNRSLYELSVFDAAALVESCIGELAPSKILIVLGETDLRAGVHTIPEIVEAYSRLIADLRRRYSCKIVVVSVCGDSDLHPEELNRKLEDMAHANSALYADITAAASAESPEIDAFCSLRCFMLDRVGFFDAMCAGA